MSELNSSGSASAFESVVPEVDESYLKLLTPQTPSQLLPPVQRQFTIPVLTQSSYASRSLPKIQVAAFKPDLPNESTSTWLNRLADAYTESGFRNQDLVHDPILLKLLFSTYSVENSINSPNQLAYHALRGTPPQGRLGAPLYILTNQQAVKAIETKAIEPSVKTSYANLNLAQSKSVSAFFIRDFAQIYSSGNVTLANLVIEDNAQFSSFANDFNSWVSQVNQRLTLATPAEKVRPFKLLGHRDAIQLIPSRVNDINQFAGALMRHVTVQNNLINAKGSALQGIFASDGAFKDIKIINNAISTAGSHTITINGLLRGEIRGNKDIMGNPLPYQKIRCLPLRIGGGANIYVLSFKNSVPVDHPYFYNYDSIVGIDPQSDLRSTKIGITNPSATFFERVDMVKYQALVRAEVVAGKTPDYSLLMKQLVQQGHAIPV
jgi:hypothetical protein